MLAAVAVIQVVLGAGVTAVADGAAAPAATPVRQLKLATVGFSQVGLSDAQAAFFSEHFSLQLSKIDQKNLRVATPKDMAAVLGIERQKQLLGCSDDQSSCMAELAGALGADGLVTGQIAKVGQSYQLNLKILAADGSRTLFQNSSELLSSEEALIGELNAVALAAAESLREQGLLVRPPPQPASRNKLKLLPGLLGVAGVALGSVAFANAASRYARLTDMTMWGPDYDAARASSDRDDGKQSVALGTVFAVAGLVILTATLLWFFLT